jgi:hypothetical protein
MHFKHVNLCKLFPILVKASSQCVHREQKAFSSRCRQVHVHKSTCVLVIEPTCACIALYLAAYAAVAHGIISCSERSRKRGDCAARRSTAADAEGNSFGTAARSGRWCHTGCGCRQRRATPGVCVCVCVCSRKSMNVCMTGSPPCVKAD